MQTLNNRDFRRDECRCPVRLRLEHDRDREILGETRNISLTGMYLVTADLDALLPMGAKVDVQAWIAPGEAVVLRTRGSIIRCEPFVEESGPVLGVAIRFDGVLEYQFPSRRP
jgi:hypothetical protein